MLEGTNGGSAGGVAGSPPVVRTAFLNGLAELLLKNRIPAHVIESEIGFDPFASESMGLTVPMNAVARLLERGAAATGNQCFAVDIARDYERRQQGVLGHVLHFAPDVGEACRIVATYIPLLLYRIRAEFHVDRSGDGTLTWSYPVGLTAPRGQFSLFLVALLILRLRFLTRAKVKGEDGAREDDPRKHAIREDLRPKLVELQIKAPEGCDLDPALFSAGPRFNSRINCITFDSAVLKIVNPRHEAAQYRLLLKMLAGLWHDATETEQPDLVTQVQTAIKCLLPGGAPSRGDVAGEMGQPESRLRRRLAAKNTSFTELLDHTRQELAEFYLRDTDMAMSDIAFQLGFQEMNAFGKACLRWFNEPPTRQRSRLRRDPL